MSVAAWRIRKRIRKLAETQDALLVDEVLNIIDEELEAEAERQYTRPINPDPATRMAVENKEAK